MCALARARESGDDVWARRHGQGEDRPREFGPVRGAAARRQLAVIGNKCTSQRTNARRTGLTALRNERLVQLRERTPLRLCKCHYRYITRAHAHSRWDLSLSFFLPPRNYLRLDFFVRRGRERSSFLSFVHLFFFVNNKKLIFSKLIIQLQYFFILINKLSKSQPSLYYILV